MKDKSKNPLEAILGAEQKDLETMGKLLPHLPKLTKLVEEISLERIEQLTKHNRSVEDDVKVNAGWQLAEAAQRLTVFKPGREEGWTPPNGWDEVIWKKMLSKSYRDRLVTAMALLWAEVDRIDYLVEHPEAYGAEEGTIVKPSEDAGE